MIPLTLIVIFMGAVILIFATMSDDLSAKVDWSFIGIACFQIGFFIILFNLILDLKESLQCYQQ